MKRIGHIETFKSQYTKEEKAELLAWFEQRMDRLPQELQMDDALSTKNLPRTVQAYSKLLSAVRKNRNTSFNGYVAQLMLMREALLRDGFE